MIVAWNRRSSYDYNYPNKYPSCNSWTYVSESRTLVLNASVLWYLAPQFRMIQFCMALFRIHTACSMQWLWVYPTTSTSDHLVVRYSSGPIRHIAMLWSGKIANIIDAPRQFLKGVYWQDNSNPWFILLNLPYNILRKLLVSYIHIPSYPSINPFWTALKPIQNII